MDRILPGVLNSVTVQKCEQRVTREMAASAGSRILSSLAQKCPDACSELSDQQFLLHWQTLLPTDRVLVKSRWIEACCFHSKNALTLPKLPRRLLSRGHGSLRLVWDVSVLVCHFWLSRRNMPLAGVSMTPVGRDG